MTDSGSNIKAALIAEFEEEKLVEYFAHKLNGVRQAVLGLSESEGNSVENPVEIPEDKESSC